MTKQVVIHNKTKRVITQNGVDLLPGKITLAENVAENFLNHPHTEIRISRDLIALGEGAKIPKGKKAAVGGKASTGEMTPAQKAAATKKAKADAAAKEKADADAAAAAGAGDAPKEPPYGIAGLSDEDAIAKIAEIEDAEYLGLVAQNEDYAEDVVTAARERVIALGEQK